MTKKTDLISVVIACYKDAESIPIMYKRIKETFKKLSSEYEIIFVNDGSPDNTTEVLEKLCSGYCSCCGPPGGVDQMGKHRARYSSLRRG